MMADGKYCPAELALVGELRFLLDQESQVFSQRLESIRLRIEVFGFFLSSSFLSYNVTVAGLQWMDSKGEHLVQ